MKTITIHQSIYIQASPQQVYQLYLDADLHASITGGPAQIEAKVGGQMQAYGDYITGTFIELIPNKKIVQTWKASEEKWTHPEPSILTLTFKPEREGTIIELLQENVPADLQEDFEKGWHQFYWEPMKAFLNQDSSNI